MTGHSDHCIPRRAGKNYVEKTGPWPHTRQFRARPAIAVAVLLAVGNPGSPAAALTAEQAVRQFVAPMVSSVDLPAGVAVGVYQRGATTFYHFGVRDRDRNPVDERTIFEIGSVTKTFSAALLAEAVDAGRIDLNGSIVPHLPKGLTLQAAAEAITPLELATFTSGLPDDPPDLPRRISLRGIKHYTKADFFRFLSRWSPDGPLPAPYLYSNVGVGLLGFIVAGTIEGWKQQVRERITGPLSMVDTVVEPSDEQQSRLAQGFRKNGKPAPPWPVFAWAAAGALRSTSHDLVAYLKAQLGHGNAPADLIKAMALTHQPHFRISPKRPRYQALTWVVVESGDGSVLFKDGGTAGFSSFVGFSPDKDLGLVILANWSGAPVVKRGLEVIGHIDDGR